MQVHQQWLNQTVEEIIDPDVAVIDCHHHFYHGRGEYFPFQPDYLAGELAADLNDGHRVAATVAVECGFGYRTSGPDALRSLGETEFMLDCASHYREQGLGDTDVCRGVVPCIDLRQGAAVEEAIQAQREVAGERLVGIRQMAAKPIGDKGLVDGESLLLNREFQAGFNQLAAHNLCFDVWILHPQIPEVTALAKRFPDTTLILNHFGAPLGIGPFAGRRTEVMRQWKKDLQALSELHNVAVKLGGLNMTINGFGWEDSNKPPGSDALLAATRHYYLTTIDLFGPARCLFESNFPVEKVSLSYRTLWNAYKKLAREFNREEAQGLLAGNAERVYGLG